MLSKRMTAGLAVLAIAAAVIVPAPAFAGLAAAETNKPAPVPAPGTDQAPLGSSGLVKPEKPA